MGRTLIEAANEVQVQE